MIGEKFTPFFPASDSDIESIWDQIHAIDSSKESLTAKNISSKRSYGIWNIAVRFGTTVFRSRSVHLNHAPFATQLDYLVICLLNFMFFLILFLVKKVTKSFDQVFGSTTDESYRPSLSTKAMRKKTLPFSASVQKCSSVTCGGCFTVNIN